MDQSLASRVLPPITAALLLLAAFATHASTCFVTPAGSGADNGSSWSNSATLPIALANVSCTEIWAAAGIYRPTATSDRSISFRVAAGVALYGGFAGSEALRTLRNPALNRTVLSGDIDGNDLGDNGIQVTTATIQGSNSYHVVYLDGTVVGHEITSSTVIDGFFITAGDAAGSGNDGDGGGLFCNASLVKPTAQCSPILRNIVFSGNRARITGGALQNWAIYGGSASPTLENVTFRGNAVYDPGGTARGGAMYNEGYGGESSPVLVNVTFANNSASNTSSDAQGGAMFNSGYGGTSNPQLTNVTFTGNSADYGGAIFNTALNTGTCHPVLVNTLLWGNTAGVSGGPQIDETNGAASTISYSLIEGGCPSGSICSTSPIALDPRLGALQDNGGFVPTAALEPGSHAIDAGSDAACPPTDARGITRPHGAHCDIGAYEATDPIFASGFETP